jgi:hypothetical protein
MAECRKDDSGVEILSRAVDGNDFPIHWLSHGQTLRRCLFIMEPPEGAPDGARSIAVVRGELATMLNIDDASVVRLKDTPLELTTAFESAGLAPPPVSRQDPAHAATEHALHRVGLLPVVRHRRTPSGNLTKKRSSR